MVLYYSRNWKNNETQRMIPDPYLKKSKVSKTLNIRFLPHLEQAPFYLFLKKLDIS